MEDRFRDTIYSRKACVAALRGEAIPSALGVPLHRLCVIRAIRHHEGFGEELRGFRPVFTRTLHARAIMSNVVPAIDTIEGMPYCIWYPGVASAQTYQEIATRYPAMLYQVARACAVAGYTDLYKQLNVLPDVHIAEEARECGNIAIYNLIMAQPARYDIMDDYQRRIKSEDPKRAYLNGDTCVRWMLDIKQGFQDVTAEYEEDSKNGEIVYMPGLWDDEGFKYRTFDLTEDMHIDEYDSDPAVLRLSADRLEIQLLSSPLPLELPTVQKDLLILMAAYYGDVDRYSRLRRPEFVDKEYHCCVRGIYHNTLFAVWWSKQSELRLPRLNQAIDARFIMNNVLSGAPYRSKPYLIWWPQFAKETTYRRLADIQPDMLPQIMHACMEDNYQGVSDELLPRYTPDRDMVETIATHPQLSSYFKTKLDARVEELGIILEDSTDYRRWRVHLSNLCERGETGVCREIDGGAIGTDFDVPYNGVQCDIGLVNTLVSLPPEWLLDANHPKGYADLDYDEDWPPGIGRTKSMRPGGMDSDGDEDTGSVTSALAEIALDTNKRSTTSPCLD